MNIWVWGLSFGTPSKNILGTWLVTMAKKLWRRRTEVQGESTTLLMERSGSPREVCSWWWRALSVRPGPLRAQTAGTQSAYMEQRGFWTHSKNVIQPMCFGFKLIPHQVSSRKDVLTPLRWVYNFYRNTLAKHFAASSAGLTFGAWQTWVWIFTHSLTVCVTLCSKPLSDFKMGIIVLLTLRISYCKALSPLSYLAPRRHLINNLCYLKSWAGLNSVEINISPSLDSQTSGRYFFKCGNPMLQ